MYYFSHFFYGDFFHPLPFGYVKLEEIIKRDENSLQLGSWRAFKDEKGLLATIGLTQVWGIVATQDCDTATSPYITFFRIEPFAKAIKQSPPDGGWSSKAYSKLIREKSRENAKWFFLPIDEEFGIDEKMGVTFHSTFQLDRKELENYKHLRMGKLNEESNEHYRESIANYFRRYPYDEWYPLTCEEFLKYKKEYPLAKPREWQKDPVETEDKNILHSSMPVKVESEKVIEVKDQVKQEEIKTQEQKLEAENTSSQKT